MMRKFLFTGQPGFAVMAGMLLLLMRPLVPFAQETANQPDESQFFQTLRDVPLMPGLYEMRDQAVMFDKPGGRIVESMAESDSESIDSGVIKAFYNDTLPQLGWRRVADDSFVREGEKLRIQIDEQTGYNIVHFMVAPDESHRDGPKVLK